MRSEQPGFDNLRTVYQSALNWELEDGQSYYTRQFNRLSTLAKEYGISTPSVVAAFCALSPNNSEKNTYLGLLACLRIVSGEIPETSKVSAYTVNKTKALRLLRRAPVETVLRGLKVYAFYRNTMDPYDSNYVTVDAHIHGAWVGRRLLVHREGALNAGKYHAIATDIRNLADIHTLPAPMVQATLWLSWKRLQNVLWERPQMKFDFGEE